MKKIIVTGASGLLGRSVYSTLQANSDYNVDGWSLNRSLGGILKKVNLLDKTAVITAVESFKVTYRTTNLYLVRYSFDVSDRCKRL